MNAPKTAPEGTIQHLVELLLPGELAAPGTEGIAACVAIHAAERMSYIQKDLTVGPERTADLKRKLSLAEVARFRGVFQQILDAFEDLPPSAFEQPSHGLTVIHGGDA